MDRFGTGTKGRRRAFISCALLSLILLGLLPSVSMGASKAAVPLTPASKKQELDKLIEGAKAEGKVVWRDGLKPEEATPIIDAFQKKYPFLKVDHARVSGTDSRERMLREMLAGIVNTDIFDLGGEQVPIFKKSGLLEKYDWTKAFDVRPEQVDQDQLLLTVGAQVMVVGYNTKLVNQRDLPKSWEDLLDPKWKGKLVVDTRPKTYLHLMPNWGEERVLAFLKKLVANKPKFRRGQTESIELMASGEFPMIAGTIRNSVLFVKEKGAPVEALLLEPVPITFEDEAVARNASHPNAGKLLLGWLATEGQKYYDQVTKRGIALPGFDTDISRLVRGKTLSLSVGEWVNRSAELEGKMLQAMGRE
jgi:iron(III) transport system substrate-binding protein